MLFEAFGGAGSGARVWMAGVRPVQGCGQTEIQHFDHEYRIQEGVQFGVEEVFVATGDDDVGEIIADRSLDLQLTVTAMSLSFTKLQRS